LLFSLLLTVASIFVALLSARQPSSREMTPQAVETKAATNMIKLKVVQGLSGAGAGAGRSGSGTGLAVAALSFGDGFLRDFGFSATWTGPEVSTTVESCFRRKTKGSSTEDSRVSNMQARVTQPKNWLALKYSFAFMVITL
jgi:hypothetical protein